MNNNDRYKRLVKFGSAAVIMILHTVMYYCVWILYYNRLMTEPFWRRGNWLLAGLY